MNSSALESFAFWTGIATVGFTAAAAISGCFAAWFASMANSLIEQTSTVDVRGRALDKLIAQNKKFAHATRQTTVVFTAVAAGFGCFVWWFSSIDSEMKKEARLRVDREHESKMKAAESEVTKAREETAKALADAAAANERTGTLELKAAGLLERAARAEHMIKAAEVQSEEANKEAARAGEGTAKALAETAANKERASKLEVEAAALRERAARAESELMKVKERIKWRTISDAQRARLLQDLKPIPRGPVKIIAVMGDEEAGRFARQIADILKEAGWDDAHVRRGIFRGNINSFEIRIRDREKIPIFALQIAQAFDSIRFEPIIVVDRSVAEGAIEIVVGMKPDSE